MMAPDINMRVKITALLAAHNRRDITIEALKNLYRQKNIEKLFELSVVLTDDGSTDGTSEAVERQLPQVKVVHGGGDLFWCGGMCFAYENARDDGADFYLLLNDDTHLYDDAIKKALDVYFDKSLGGKPEHIIVGSTVNPESNKLSYGGAVRVSRWHPFHYNLVTPLEHAQACDTFNGNFVLIHHSVIDNIGFLDDRYTHWFGDTDYGLMAAKAGFGLWVTPGFVGECAENDPNIHWDSAAYSFTKRVKMFFNVKGRPVNESMIFCRKHGGLAWPLFWLMPIIRGLFFPTRYDIKAG